MSEVVKKIQNISQIKKTLQSKTDANLLVEGEKIMAQNCTKGMQWECMETSDGVEVHMKILAGSVISKPIGLCFSVLDADSLQRIQLNLQVEKGAQAQIRSHCFFQSAGAVQHIANLNIVLEEGASLYYVEKHTHNNLDFLKIFPNMQVSLGARSQFYSVLEMIEGRAGVMEMDYQVVGEDHSVADMVTKINGTLTDVINIRESAELKGVNAKAILRTRIAVTDQAQATVWNKIVAKNAGCFGHIDCTEILRQNGVVKAYPTVEVLHPLARVTHEANLGGVDGGQLETLMARGLTELEAEEWIIKGLLS